MNDHYTQSHRYRWKESIGGIFPEGGFKWTLNRGIMEDIKDAVGCRRNPRLIKVAMRLFGNRPFSAHSNVAGRGEKCIVNEMKSQAAAKWKPRFCGV